MPQPGFTKQELEAFEWSKQHKKIDGPRNSRRKDYSPVSSSPTDSSDSDIPKDPFNPLLLSTAKGYRHSRDSVRHSLKPKSRNRSKSRDRSRSPQKWDHELFYTNIESQSDEERRPKYKGDFDTRIGAWRSRAGGAYLPPEKPLSQDERDRMYPTYSSKKIPSSPCRKRHRSYSPSPTRPSPTYDL